MSIEDLSPERLSDLRAIRARRRELSEEASKDFRELLSIANGASARRSDKRHRFMLLAGGIAGVAAPLLLQRTSGMSPALVRGGTVLLLVNVVVGAIFDAIEDRRTTSILTRASAVSQAGAALAFAEDMKLISARTGQPDPESDRAISAARATVESANGALREAAGTSATVDTLETILFFGAFVLGVVLLLLAVGTAPAGTAKAG